LSLKLQKRPSAKTTAAQLKLARLNSKNDLLKNSAQQKPSGLLTLAKRPTLLVLLQRSQLFLLQSPHSASLLSRQQQSIPRRCHGLPRTRLAVLQL
jgi:hypothetical protein